MRVEAIVQFVVRVIVVMPHARYACGYSRRRCRRPMEHWGPRSDRSHGATAFDTHRE